MEENKSHKYEKTNQRKFYSKFVIFVAFTLISIINFNLVYFSLYTFRKQYSFGFRFNYEMVQMKFVGVCVCVCLCSSSSSFILFDFFQCLLFFKLFGQTEMYR